MFLFILLSIDVSGSIKFWHYTSGKCVLTINEDGRQTLNSAFNSSGDKFVTSGADAVINLYDEHTKQKILTCEARYGKI